MQVFKPDLSYDVEERRLQLTAATRKFKKIFVILAVASFVVPIVTVVKLRDYNKANNHMRKQQYLQILNQLAVYYRLPSPFCESLLSGTDKTALPSEGQKSVTPHAKSNDDYMYANCELLLRAYIVDDELLSWEERSMSIAFAIHMYKDVWQFERLLRAVYRPHHFYCIHVDRKTPNATFQAVQRIASCFERHANVIVTENRTSINWGTISQVHAELTCMRELYKRSNKWKYFINLTGQEFPLKTMWELVRILTALNGSNSMEATVERMNPERQQEVLPFALKHNITPVKGALHIVVVREFVQFLFENLVSIALLEYLEDASFPDETYFATLNHNPSLRAPGGYLGVPETSDDVYPYFNRLKNWGDMPCHGFFQRAICVWGVGDLPFITNSSRKELFVNKLVWDYQHHALDCLESWHWNRTLKQLGTYFLKGTVYQDVSYYANLSLTRHHS